MRRQQKRVGRRRGFFMILKTLEIAMNKPEFDVTEEEQEEEDHRNDEDDEDERLNREQSEDDEENEGPYSDDM